MTQPLSTGAVEVLLAHDRWATHRLLDACAGLSDEQFHQRFTIGIGSLHDTLVHNIGAIQVWADVLANAPSRPWISSDRRSVPQLRQLFDVEHAHLVRSAAGDMGEVYSRERNGVVSRYTRGVILMHVSTHGVHHRAQCLNMLRQLGVASLPQSSVVEWSRAGGV